MCPPCCLVLLQRLAEIVSLLPGLNPSTRLLDVGSGTGCLLPHLQARGVADITAVDLSATMLEQLSKRFPAPSVCGNEPGKFVFCSGYRGTVLATVALVVLSLHSNLVCNAPAVAPDYHEWSPPAPWPQTEFLILNAHAVQITSTLCYSLLAQLHLVKSLQTMC